MLKQHKKWIILGLFVVLVAPLTPWLDMGTAQYFYDKGAGIEHFVKHPVLDFFYVYGLVPAQLTFTLAAIALIFSLIPRFRWWRPHALYLTLVLAVGSGFIIHAVFKDHWGRPRPKQVIEFGGQNAFRPFYKPNFSHQTEQLKSFPCGHCSMGFYFITFIYMGRRFQIRSLYALGIALTFFLGIALSYTRIAQGGHFLTDIFFSAIIMWMTAAAFDWMIYEELYERAH